MKTFPLLAVLGFFFSIIGCSGVQTFPNRVAIGETVAVAAGWKHHFSRDNITVTITPQGGAAIPVTSDRIRASVNLYPDPLSSLVLSSETSGNISPNSSTYATLVNANFTGDDADWWQTTVFIDIPDNVGLLSGLADLTISNPEGESVTATVRIVDPDPSFGGTQDSFNAELAGPLDDQHLTSLERVDHYVVSFSGVLPYAVQLDLSYANLSGYVVNPRGLSKNLSWTDNTVDGSYRVILMPVDPQQGFRSMNDLKFYVAALAGTQATASLDLVPGALLAFDQNGAPVTVSATVAPLVRGAAGLN